VGSMNVLLAIAGVLGKLQQRGPETVVEQNEQVDGQILHGRWGSPDPVNAIIGHDLFRSCAAQPAHEH
jgi:hypothetical protein